MRVRSLGMSILGVIGLDGRGTADDVRRKAVRRSTAQRVGGTASE